jgi:hypothetical protein
MQPKMHDVSLADLHFDPENPRLPERLRHAAEEEVLEYLLLECNVIELMLSIGEQDFFVGEPVLVVPRKEGGFTVVEGNRRLGSLKLLQPNVEAPVMPTQVNQARRGAKFHPTSIPVLEFAQRDEILTYLGYRHITGIKEWDALAKARYLGQLRLRYGPDHLEAHRALAREIGSRAPHVAKLLTGLTLLERARDSGLLNKLRLKEEDIPFSLLTTGIGYENLCKFIGLENGSDVEANNIKDVEFEEFITWVFAKSAGSTTVLGESRNFDKLARVVANEQALMQLRRKVPLENADLYTSGPLEAVRQLMQEVEQRIINAQAALSFAEGFDENDVAQADRLRKAAAAFHGALHGLVNPAN